jgi:DNA-binding ferritin-like protein (Dps family)
VSGFLEKVIGDGEQKKRWKQYRARVKGLPAPFRTAADGLERYLLYRAALAKGDVVMSMHEELVTILEGAAAQRVPVRSVVGTDPVQFADALLSKFAAGQWIDHEQQQLLAAIDQAGALERGGAR